MINSLITAKPFQGDSLLTDRQIASRLSIGRSTVWHYASKGILTPVKLGQRCTRFRASQVQALIEGGAV